MFKFETLLGGLCECSCCASEASEMGERGMGWCEERHDCSGDAGRQLNG